jgi:hypothetical protein
MKDCSLFYAWQSDLKQKDHRYFIRDAALLALERIARDSDLEDSPRLDSDTKDESGMIAIAETIFKKIRKSSLFLGDVSIVRYVDLPEDEEDKKKPNSLPNSNVMIELGYAAGSIGWDRIICVMNTVHGPAADLPFDLRYRRWPITYELTPETASDERKKQFEALAKGIELAVKISLQKEHEAVTEAIELLDYNCLLWMEMVGSVPYFRYPIRQTKGEIIDNLALDAAIPRLLSLGLLRCDINPEKKKYAYHWTYIGVEVLKKLGYRK